jgi:hypothetical protein
LLFLKTLNDTKEEIIHIITHTIISNGQCIHAITLDKFIRITRGKNIYHVFLYHAKNNQVKNATLTVA